MAKVEVAAATRVVEELWAGLVGRLEGALVPGGGVGAAAANAPVQQQQSAPVAVMSR